MNQIIRDIIDADCTKEGKINMITQLSNDIETAKGIISGKYKYCKDCDDYYLADSFLSDNTTKSAKICVYQDPINSGGNDYADGFVHITYSICPKGHKHEVDRYERRK